MFPKSISIAVLLIAVLCALAFLTTRPDENPDASFSLPADSSDASSRDAVSGSPDQAIMSRHVRVVADDAHRFVGNAACVNCHSDVWQHYQHSGMSQTWAPVDSTVMDAIDSNVRIADAENAFAYQILIASADASQRNATIRIRETHPEKSDWHRDMSASFRIGSGRHAFGLAHENNGYLTQLPLAWYAHDGQWGLSPGYELHNRRFSRTVQSECIACHGGRTQPTHSVVDRFSVPIESGISCEQCHGPGQDHVAFQSSLASQPSTDDQSRTTDRTIVNPGRLQPEQANDVCLQCHLQGDAVVFRPGCDAFSFRPGDRLRDHRIDFLAKSADSDVLGVASHGARMLQSACWSQSEGRLTCILCHDAHDTVDRTPVASFDQKCLTCHDGSDCHRPTTAANTEQATDALAADTQNSCVRCHMPQRPTRERQHLVFTDHRIQRPTPGEIPEGSILSPNADVELIDLRPEDELDVVTQAAAYIQLHETMGPQQPALRKAGRLLETAFSSAPDDPEMRYWLASVRISEGNGADAVRLLRPVVAHNSQWLEARFRLGIAYDQGKDYQSAIRLYEGLVSDVPDWLEVYPLLSRLYLFQQQSKKAEQLLRQQLTFRDDAEAYAALALAYRLQNKPLAECLQPLDRSLALDPVLTNALLNRGYLLAEAGRVQEARRDFEAVLHLEPQHAKAQAGLKLLSQTPRPAIPQSR